jgi:hypothetical protein
MIFSHNTQLCDVKGERYIAALMASCLFSVHEYAAVIIHRPEMQQDPAFLLAF